MTKKCRMIISVMAAGVIIIAPVLISGCATGNDLETTTVPFLERIGVVERDEKGAIQASDGAIDGLDSVSALLGALGLGVPAAGVGGVAYLLRRRKNGGLTGTAVVQTTKAIDESNTDNGKGCAGDDGSCV